MCLRITSASMPVGVKRAKGLLHDCVRASAISLGLTSTVCRAVEQPVFSAQKAKILFHEGASPLQAMRPSNRAMGPTGEVLSCFWVLHSSPPPDAPCEEVPWIPGSQKSSLHSKARA